MDPSTKGMDTSIDGHMQSSFKKVTQKSSADTCSYAPTICNHGPAGAGNKQ